MIALRVAVGVLQNIIIIIPVYIESIELFSRIIYYTLLRILCIIHKIMSLISWPSCWLTPSFSSSSRIIPTLSIPPLQLLQPLLHILQSTGFFSVVRPSWPYSTVTAGSFSEITIISTIISLSPYFNYLLFHLRTTILHPATNHFKMEPRRTPPEYFLEIFADTTSVRDVLKGTSSV